MGGPNVTLGAMLKCSFGMSPVPMVVIPQGQPVLIEGKLAATIMDNKMVNVPTFGMCQSMSNPQVAAATAAALGVLTPMPCLPQTPAPWAPGAAKTMIGGKPALTGDCKLNCIYGGLIEISNPGTQKTKSN